ncbi:MAG: cell division protein FtsL [Aquabacterium sp.]|nr:MAG: cell division protein FtsL [Aquabacterium sp.]
MNLLLAAALLASALYLVRTTYESRKLFVALEAEHARERRLQIELEQLEVAKRAQATPLRVEKIAREKLRMFNASPALTHYVPAAGASAPAVPAPAGSGAVR